ncbi:MAG: hypothetical protein NT007_04665 [Candidatus Kapabacteria bacterium]|nr:hypothetical protein [Candidatus Kapabacteria bacterium]
MISKLRHITTILLLVVFPLASLNLQFSVRKCNRRGLLQLRIFNSEINLNLLSFNPLACCEINPKNNSGKQEKNRDCCKPNGAANAGSEDDGCEFCKKSDKSSTNENSDSDDNILEYKTIKTGCCSNSIVSNTLQGSFVNSDIQISAKIFNSATIADIQRKYIPISYQGDEGFKDIFYPLKEPISQIISFIHFTSNAEDCSDATDAIC